MGLQNGQKQNAHVPTASVAYSEGGSGSPASIEW